MKNQSKQRKICIATTSVRTLFFYTGLSDILRKNGWSVTFLSGGDSQLFPQCYPFCDRVVRQKLLVRKPKIFQDLFCFFSLWFFFLRNRFDVVYVASPKAGLLVSVAAFLTGRRVLYSIIGRAYETCTGIRRRFYVFLDKIACFCSHRIVTVSPSLRDAVLADRCCVPQKISQINLRPRIVDKSIIFTPSKFSDQDRKELREKLGVPQDAFIFLFVGRICRDKGVGELVAAFQKIWRENVYLVLVGADDDPSRILGSETWNYINNSTNVVRTGRVDFESVPQYYHVSDVFVCPTYREALSGVGIEASLMELSVILTDAIGAKDSLLDGETGVMVPIKQVEPLANAMKLLMENSDLRKRMGKQGRKFALERFKRPMDEEIMDFFNKFIEEKHW